MCVECGNRLSGMQKKFCSDKCRYRHRDFSADRRLITCADCGAGMFKGPGSLPQGEAVCRACRATKQKIRRWPNVCPDCKCPCVGIRCRRCSAKFRTIRADGDGRLRRSARERDAPGTTYGQRKRILDGWKKRGVQCIYCTEPATTIDHVIPLVRGGTNHEGNLAPCCKRCNSSKAGWTVIEWRTGLRLPPMSTPPAWAYPSTPKPKRIKPIRPIVLSPCVICTEPTPNTRCCSDACRTEWTRRCVRDRYRSRVGLPVDPSRPTKPWLRAMQGEVFSDAA